MIDATGTTGLFIFFFFFSLLTKLTVPRVKMFLRKAIVTMVMHGSQYPFSAFDPFIQTLDFNNNNPECLEGTMTPTKEQILLHSTINI